MTPYTKGAAQRLIMVLLQPHIGAVHPISMELSGAACILAAEAGLKTVGVFIAGELTSTALSQLSNCGLDEVYLYQDERFSPFIPELHSAALLHSIEALFPDILLIGATLEGRSIAPIVAVALESGVTADCTELTIDGEGQLVQTRPAFGGSLMAQIITCEARPQIATVRYGIFRDKVCNTVGKSTNLIHSHAYHLPLARTHVEELTVPSSYYKEEAVYVLAIGAAVRGREDIKLFSRMSESIGAKLMCSRVLVERGWLTEDLQIGLSGNCIAPALLIAMGISGSVQFMAGIQGAKSICAVNTDANAHIMQIADTALICDIYQVASLF